MTTMTNMLREQIHIEIAFNNTNNMGTQVYTWYHPIGQRHMNNATINISSAPQ